MLIHRYNDGSDTLFTVFDEEDNVVEYPTFYLRQLRRHKRSQKSQKHISDVLKSFCQWLEENTSFKGLNIDNAIESVTKDDLLEWIISQRGSGISETTINNRELLLREFYKWLTTEESGPVFLNTPLYGKPLTRKSHRRLPRFVTSAQVTKLLRGLYNEGQRVATHFMYDTGVRVSELVRFSLVDLPNESDWPDDVNYYPLLVRGSKSYDGNEYKYRFTIISRPVLARVRRYHSTTSYLLARRWNAFDENKPVFLNTHGNRLTISSVQKMIAAAWHRQGGDPKEISPHRLRHGTAFSILQSEMGKDYTDRLLTVKSMFGHEQISTTEIYSSIPMVVIQSLANSELKKRKYEEAQKIFDDTYLPSRLETEKRGHGKSSIARKK